MMRPYSGQPQNCFAFKKKFVVVYLKIERVAFSLNVCSNRNGTSVYFIEIDCKLKAFITVTITNLLF